MASSSGSTMPSSTGTIVSHQSSYVKFATHSVAGGLSGAFAKSATAPIERIKLLLQTQAVNSAIPVEMRYKGPIDCVLRVYREQGLLSFWRGNVANCLRYVPNAMLSFSFKEGYKSYFVGDAAVNSFRFVAGNLLSGGLAGGSALLLTFPLDMARTKLAVDVSGKGGTRAYSGTIDCIHKTFMRENGLRGVYSGFGTAVLGQVIFKALFLGGYDVCKGLIGEDGGVASKILAGQIITTTAGTLCYPIDTVRRRMMMSAKTSAGTPRYTSGWQCFRLVIVEEGIRGLFAGLSVNLFRGISGPLLLVMFDLIKDKLQ